MSEKLCLKWNDFQDNINTAFGNLRNDQDFSDVTLVCEDGEQVEAHKIILQSASPFFQTQSICEKLNLESVHTTGLDVQSYRKAVTEACNKLNEQRLRKQAEGKTKTKRIETEVYGKKEYLAKKKIENVRIQFRARYGMLPFAGNYGHDRKFAHSEWLCSCREQREEESHLLEGSCTVYGDIRERYGDLEDDDDLVDFFNEILARREELDARGLEEQALEVEPNTSDDASLGTLPEQASMGT